MILIKLREARLIGVRRGSVNACAGGGVTAIGSGRAAAAVDAALRARSAWSLKLHAFGGYSRRAAKFSMFPQQYCDGFVFCRSITTR